MKTDNLNDAAALVELGSVSTDTKGLGGPHWETGGLARYPGLSDE
jgi:hypothetical protein